MKNLLVTTLLMSGSCLFAQVEQSTQHATTTTTTTVTQTTVQAPAQPAPQHKGKSVRLQLYGTYAFDDKVDSYYSSTSYYNGKIKGGFEYGGGIEFMLNPAYGVELLYLRLDSKAPMEYYDGVVKNTTFDLASNYILLSGNRYLVINPKIEPYAGIQLGMAIFNLDNPDNGKEGTATKFAWGVRAGVNIWASDKVGIKLQAGLLSAVQSVGGGLYFGTGGGGAGVSGYSTFYQFNLGGGLVFRLK
jgi:hypothetical protein